MNAEQVLREFRANPSGADKIYRRLKDRGVKVTLDGVRDVLLGPKKENGKRDRRKAVKQYVDYSEPAQTKRYRTGGLMGKKNAKMRPIIVNEVGDIFECDLIDSVRHPVLFKGMRAKYALIVIDDFSKYVWGFPLRQKTKAEIQKAFEKLFEKHVPDTLISDQEAAIQALKSWLEERGIEWVNKNHSAPTVESVIRTLKLKANRMRDVAQGDVDLQEVIDKYNDDVHGVTKHTPEDVLDDKKHAQFQARIRQIVARSSKYDKAKEFYKQFDFEIGDYVNAAKKDAFLKGTSKQFDDKTLIVNRQIGNTVQVRTEGGALSHYFPWQIRQIPINEAVNRVQPVRRAQPRRAARAEPVVEEKIRPKRQPRAPKPMEDDTEGLNEQGRRYQGREKYTFRKPTLQEALAALKRR